MPSILIRNKGCFGLIATNTIAQGDTRHTGLRWICTHGGAIYSARKRFKWPGEAAVVVSVVHVRKGPFPGPRLLDEKPLEQITAFLFHTGGDEDPKPLRANAGKSYEGCIVLGMGFTFDDTNPEATPIAEMERLIARDPRNAERIFPYIGGEEVNNSPTQSPYRYVIDFADMPLERAREWPHLVSIVESKVRPQRANDKREIYRRLWWQFAEKRVDLNRAKLKLDRILVVNCGATPHMSFAFLPSRMVFANTLAVFTLDSIATFCILQSRVHESWVRFFGSSMKDDLRYTPTDCFETFPFPDKFDSTILQAGGREYYEFRAQLMIKNAEGLTKTYNRFHDQYETSGDILRLRELHDAIDRAALRAYGWTDLQASCEFIPIYRLENEGDAGEVRTRYRWPDEIRDEVLARLLALNAQRAEQERLSGAAADGHPKNNRQSRGAKRVAVAQASFQPVKIEE